MKSFRPNARCSRDPRALPNVEIRVPAWYESEYNWSVWLYFLLIFIKNKVNGRYSLKTVYVKIHGPLPIKIRLDGQGLARVSSLSRV